jgi:hypothetical protein
VEVTPAYQAKIATLWEKYQQKRVQVQALMAKSDAILRNLVGGAFGRWLCNAARWICFAAVAS